MDAGRLSYFGFFDEFGYRVGRGVVVGNLPRSANPDKAGVVRYLRSGTPLVVMMAVWGDPLGGSERTFPGGGSAVTDGEWVWPSIAAELVALYDLAIPSNLNLRMRERRFLAEPLTDDAIREVFTMASDALSIDPWDGIRLPRMVIVEVRERSTSTIACLARAEGGSFVSGQDLRDEQGDSSGGAPYRLEGIVRAGERLNELDVGRTALVTLTGRNVARVHMRTVLFSSEIE